MKKKQTFPVGRETSGMIYQDSREMERVQSAAHSRDHRVSVEGENRKVREVFRATPKERVVSDTPVIPRAGNTAKDARFSKTPPKRIRDRAVFGHDYKPVTHGLPSSRSTAAINMAAVFRESLSDMEESEKEKSRIDAQKWAKV